MEYEPRVVVIHGSPALSVRRLFSGGILDFDYESGCSYTTGGLRDRGGHLEAIELQLPKRAGGFNVEH